MTTLSLAEYRTEPSVALTTQQRDFLDAIAPSIRVAPSPGEDGRYDLTPGSYVGAIHLPDLEIVVRPKLPINRVLFMLSYSLGLTRQQLSPFSLSKEDSLVEAIVPGFIYQVEQALKRGVLQGYRSEEDALQTVRGRLRVGDQVRKRFGISLPIEVTFDEFTEDIELNRVLRAAIARLQRMRMRSDRTRWPLRTIDNALSSVQLVEYSPGQLPRFNWTRLNARYRPAVELAKLILASAAFELDHGAVAASAFLVDMNKLFEDFVIVGLREALGVSSRTLAQGAQGHPLYLDVGRRVRLEPDISWWDGPACSFVGDVKYKAIEFEGFKHGDLYQLNAYTIATGLDQGLLIYAAGEGEPHTHQVVNIGKRLEVAWLDISGSPSDVLAQVAAVAELVRSQRKLTGSSTALRVA